MCKSVREADFVARNEKFQEFVHSIAMHITATNPLSISEQDIDPAVVEKERDIYRRVC